MSDYGVQNTSLSSLKDELFSQILLAQKEYMQVRPGDEDKKELLKTVLDQTAELKGRASFFPYISSGRGHGPFTELIDGSVKYDLIGGIGPNLLGHSHPLIIKAHLEAACSDAIMCGNLQTYGDVHDFLTELRKHLEKSQLRHFWFTGSGSFANDTALKMIWQKMAPKYRVIAFEKAFAGRSVATQDITHNEAYREGMPNSVQVDHVPHFDQKNPSTSLEKTLAALEATIKAHPDQHCALMLEIIQGEGGFVYGDKAYYEGVCKWAKKNGLIIWVDEVQSFARTHELFAFQMFGLEPYVDIVTVGKALQVCGVAFSSALNPKPGLIAGTFNSSLSAVKAGTSILKYLTTGPFYGENGLNAKLYQKFETHLNNLAKKFPMPYIGGVGTMISFEIGDSSKELTMNFIKKLFDNGVICFSAGKDPYRIRFLLPLCLTDTHIEEIFHIIERTLKEVLEA